jgi:hypothetical protein
MERVIYKYELKPQGLVEMPFDAEILTVGAQGEGIFVWASVDPTSHNVKREFMCVPTGHKYDHSGAKFLGTAFLGALVFHVFVSPIVY